MWIELFSFTFVYFFKTEIYILQDDESSAVTTNHDDN